jgi:hypothetical protein
VWWSLGARLALLLVHGPTASRTATRLGQTLMHVFLAQSSFAIGQAPCGATLARSVQ